MKMNDDLERREALWISTSRTKASPEDANEHPPEEHQYARAGYSPE